MMNPLGSSSAGGSLTAGCTDGGALTKLVVHSNQDLSGWTGSHAAELHQRAPNAASSAGSQVSSSAFARPFRPAGISGGCHIDHFSHMAGDTNKKVSQNNGDTFSFQQLKANLEFADAFTGATPTPPSGFELVSSRVDGFASDHVDPINNPSPASAANWSNEFSQRFQMDHPSFTVPAKHNVAGPLPPIGATNSIDAPGFSSPFLARSRIRDLRFSQSQAWAPSPMHCSVEAQALEGEWEKQFELAKEVASETTQSLSTTLKSDGESKAESPRSADKRLEWEDEFRRYLNSAQATDDETDEEWFSKFGHIWKSAEKESIKDAMDDFTLDFNTDLLRQGDDLDELDEMAVAVDAVNQSHGNAGTSDDQHIKESEKSDLVTSPLAPYVFEEENLYLAHQDPYSKGIDLIRTDAHLSETALAFEAAVQRDPHRSDAWMQLGKIQAENEREGLAIAALQRSVREDPSNTAALMSLAVAYVNEKEKLRAYATLGRWLKCRYPSIRVTSAQTVTSGPAMMGDAAISAELHTSLVSQLMLACDSETALVDPDVQVALGLLFYIAGDTGKSIDCLKAALELRPNDYVLWNRFGAILANSGRIEESIEAYRRALELRPMFVRARYNLGVGCIGIGCFREAADHLLSALSIHGPVREGLERVPDSLWVALRQTFVRMDRPDLVSKAENRPSLDVFRPEFEFE